MSVVVITVTPHGGTPLDITPDVDYATAQFESLVNGAPGNASLRVRDDKHSHTFATGSELTLDIDGNRMWGGYLMRVNTEYPFPVENTTTPQTVARYWNLEATDYNILLDKRIIHDPHNARTVYKLYPVGSWDDDILNDVFNNYCDLPADGISAAGITRISQAILDIPGVTVGPNTPNGGVEWNVSYTVKEVFQTVARATAGMFYIDPTKVLRYVDVETATSIYTLTDHVVNTNDIGYRNLKLRFNGANLTNDAMVWGRAKGVSNIVFSRIEDATSIATHGRWQAALPSAMLYKQVSADLVANTMVYGTPQSKRGRKDDQVSFTCAVVKPLFLPAQVVPVAVNTFSYSDNLPVRRMTITFANPKSPLQDLVLSWDPDEPWSLYEFFFPRFKPFGGFTFQPPPPPPTNPCGITDTFNRPNGPPGTADCGYKWTPSPGASLSGGQLQLVTTTGSEYAVLGGQIPFANSVSIGRFHFTSSSLHQPLQVRLSFNGNQTWAEFTYDPPNGALSVAAFDTQGDTVTGSMTGAPNALPQDVIVTVSATTLTIAVGSVSAAVNLSNANPFPIANVASLADWQFFVDAFGNGTALIDNLDIQGLNICAQPQPNCNIYDDFERTVPPDGWGTASSGIPWTIVREDAAGQIYVDGHHGALGSGNNVVQAVGGPLSALPLDVTFRFYIPYVTSGPLDPNGATLIIQLANDPFAGQFNTFEMIWAAYYSGGFGGQIVFNGNFNLPKTDWIVGWYTCRWLIDTTGQSFKVWSDAEAEPGWMISGPNTDTLTPNRFTFQGISSIAGNPVLIDDIKTSCPAEVVSEIGNALEPASSVGDQLTYQLAQAFQPGSTKVYVNGLLQRLDIDYTEQPTAARIVFANPLQPTDVVQVSYIPSAVTTPPPGPPPPVAGTAWETPFMGRTPSSPISYSGQSGTVISGLQFSGTGGPAITLDSCSNIHITACDFDGCVGGIFAVNCSNITIDWCRFNQIGDGSVGSGNSNLIQFNNVTGGYIGNNKGIGGLTEDMFSIFQSNGNSSADPIIIENNALEGTNWTSNSGSGFMLGDAGGSNIIVRNNTLLTPGQVGIGIASGTGIHVTNNTLYGAQRSNANVGLSIWNQYGTACSNDEISYNRVFWLDAGGSENPYFNAGNCGPVASESTNNFHDTSINPGSLHVVL